MHIDFSDCSGCNYNQQIHHSLFAASIGKISQNTRPIKLRFKEFVIPGLCHRSYIQVVILLLSLSIDITNVKIRKIVVMDE